MLWCRGVGYGRLWCLVPVLNSSDNPNSFEHVFELVQFIRAETNMVLFCGCFIFSGGKIATAELVGVLKRCVGCLVNDSVETCLRSFHLLPGKVIRHRFKEPRCAHFAACHQPED